MSDPNLAAFLRQVERDTESFMREIELQVEAEADKLVAKATADAERVGEEARTPVSAAHPAPVVSRRDYAPKEAESRYCVRGEDGRPMLQLVDAGDRLAVRSPLDGGVLINPKGPGLRSVGLVTTYARGVTHYAAAYRAADLRKGKPVELRRDADNPHDRNAVRLYAPRARHHFAYVQRGRAATVARRLDAGEELVGVCMWGPGRGSDNNSTAVLIGARADIDALLT